MSSAELDLEKQSVHYSPIQRMRHSAAHVMAEAVQEIFPDARFAIGPAIEDGFYYDIDLPRPLTPEDLPEIEKRMKRIVKAKHPFVHEMWPREKALEYFRQKGQVYKVEIIEGLPDAEVGMYRQGNFLDLCRGPHVENTGQIGPFKLMRVAGAYWRGDENKPMLQRIYGTAWFSQEELDQYLWRLEEAQKRDHRKLGRELKLFVMHDDLPAGVPMFLPNGEMLRHLMEGYVRELQERHGYQHVWTSHLGKVRLYKTSRHWYTYRENMFPVMKGEQEQLEDDAYILKPMNCPHHITLYKSQRHSYRELPIRYAEFATLYRYEKAGTLSGLARVRSLTQDDAHVFMRPDQVQEEFNRAIDLTLEAFKTYGLNDYWVRLSLRDPEKKEEYIGSDEIWQAAEDALRDAALGKGLKYEIGIGEAAFYGPKIDFMVRDALGREWQCSTVQLDFNQPENFELEYIGEDGQPHRPVMIHRAVTGSTERFMAMLIEHYAGAFPVWLAPVQAMVIPIADRHADYAYKVQELLKAIGLRVDVDVRGERMNAKVRDAQLQKIPYMLVVGDKEAEAEAVAVRLRTNKNLGAVPLSQFIDKVSELVRTKSLALWDEEA
ncbi:threonyl-tRNA synthetase [Thermosporothrix hazakensis]|jgi:threonyl-tRNA synthetase|uniref:Threonine--tRNA ligase n=2 Tax=Thermosporothrix TaxID=768650 RepID=A0A326UDN9_THEHA|nr:threonine--tRNA ligase [Thermosporothrix hazakensis]PZW36722.1 threonyl-tRNA synthetase [Thermosporothrix hazakensis]BBH89191.1 threonine--tRNA ligase [Thermosporothrix sp. COM3]GCE47373.1 threonine--tRNA ligase [Thermosporothrix hazakensis]